MATEEVVEEVSLRLRLMVDRKKMRVIYAECDRSMADVLISFFTIPVAALVRRAGKESGVGCMDNLYKSVEDMGPQHFQTPACRNMLLRPRSAFGFPYHRLKIRINDVENTLPCACPSGKCPKYSLFAGEKCDCGLDMVHPMPTLYPPPQNVMFVSPEIDSFVVTDDLFISPVSDGLKQSICELAGVEHRGLEEHIVLVDSDKMVELMKLSLLTLSPLTNAFLQSDSDNGTKPINWPVEFLKQHFIRIEKENLYSLMINKLQKECFGWLTLRKKMVITLFHDDKRVLFATVKRDFVDFLFNFLTFPFGSILTAVGEESASFRCLNNLHYVLKRFKSDGVLTHFYAKRRYGAYLLDPPVAYHHLCENHLLNIGKGYFSLSYCDCKSCLKKGVINPLCFDLEHKQMEMKALNPKYKGKHTTRKGGGYIGWPNIFLITSALVVKPIYDCANENYFARGLKEKSVLVHRKEALKLLIASLISQDPLTDVFF